MKIVSFANCGINSAPWLTNLYPESEVPIILHTEGLLRLIKGETIECQDINPPFEFSMPILTPIDVSSIDAFIWSPYFDECIGITTLEDKNRNPYPINPIELRKRFPAGPLYSPQLLEIIWKELDNITKSIPHRFVITYPPTHLKYDFESFKRGLPNMIKDRVEKLNKLASNLLTERGWKHFEFDPELDDSGHWSHFSNSSKEKVHRSIAKELDKLI